jgi:hypothetical protein
VLQKIAKDADGLIIIDNVVMVLLILLYIIIAVQVKDYAEEVRIIVNLVLNGLNVPISIPDIQAMLKR